MEEAFEEMMFQELDRKDVFVTNIGVTKAQAQSLMVVLEEISEKDPTFRYTIVKNKQKSVKKYGHTHIIRINSDTKSQAHRRGTWIINNCGIDDLYYWVK